MACGGKRGDMPPDPKMVAQATLQSLSLKYVNAAMNGQAAVISPVDKAVWLAAWKAAGN